MASKHNDRDVNTFDPEIKSSGFDLHNDGFPSEMTDGLVPSEQPRHSFQIPTQPPSLILAPATGGSPPLPEGDSPTASLGPRQQSMQGHARMTHDRKARGSET